MVTLVHNFVKNSLLRVDSDRVLTQKAINQIEIHNLSHRRFVKPDSMLNTQPLESDDLNNFERAFHFCGGCWVWPGAGRSPHA